MDKWFYQQGERQEGPLLFDELKKLLNDRVISVQTLVWKKDLPDWIPLEKIINTESPAANNSSKYTNNANKTEASAAIEKEIVGAKQLSQQGFVAALVCFIANLVVGILGLMRVEGKFNDPWSLVDALVYGIIAFFIRRKVSRSAAVFGLITYTFGTIYQWYESEWKPQGYLWVGILVFGFINGVRGTFRYHKLLHTKINWLRITVALFAAIIFPILIFAASYYFSLPKRFSTTELREKLNDAIVRIEIFDDKKQTEALGTGVVVSDDGLVITNSHVVESFDSGLVKIPDGGYFPIKNVIYQDYLHDIAAIKVEGKNLTHAKVDFHKALQVAAGEKVICIGNPEGLDNTISEGVISAIRKVGGLILIQTTAPISHGSSGGGMFSEAGNLIGITSMIKETGQNLNFAIPIIYAAAPIISYFDQNRNLSTISREDLNEYLGFEEKLISEMKNANEAYKNKYGSVSNVVQEVAKSKSLSADSLEEIRAYIYTSHSLVERERLFKQIQDNKYKNMKTE